jgi:hypothetical protein
MLTALGWPAAPLGSARYNAAYGTLDLRPAVVLRAAVALTGVLAGAAMAAALTVPLEILFGSLPLSCFATRRASKIAAVLVVVLLNIMLNAPTMFAWLCGASLCRISAMSRPR